MKSHRTWMILACLLPLLLIFLLPALGATGGELLFVFLILCFGVHLFMMAGHGDHDKGDKGNKDSGKEENGDGND